MTRVAAAALEGVDAAFAARTEAGGFAGGAVTEVTPGLEERADAGRAAAALERADDGKLADIFLSFDRLSLARRV